jgi:predicted transcriptional regulator
METAREPDQSSDSTRARPAHRVVRVELTQAQVDRIVRDAATDPRTSMLLSRLKEVRQRSHADPLQMDDRRLSRSLMAGLFLLESLPDDGSYLSLTEVARANGMNMSTAHRYISTLIAAGLVEQDPVTRQYRRAQ